MTEIDELTQARWAFYRGLSAYRKYIDSEAASSLTPVYKMLAYPPARDATVMMLMGQNLGSNATRSALSGKDDESIPQVINRFMEDDKEPNKHTIARNETFRDVTDNGLMEAFSADEDWESPEQSRYVAGNLLALIAISSFAMRRYESAMHHAQQGVLAGNKLSGLIGMVIQLRMEKLAKAGA